MRKIHLVILVAAVAGAVGFLAGKGWNSDRAVQPIATPAGRAAVAPSTVASKATPMEAAAPLARFEAADKFAAFGKRAAALSPDEFGKRYAELLTAADSADALLERASMLASLDAERAAAAYLAYKKRLGVPFEQNSQEIRHLLTVAGEREGAKVIAALQKTAPGFQELSSIVHGWAMKDSNAAVEWYNTLPDDDAQRKTSLDGLMWGLSQRDAATAGKVFQSLSVEDQLTSGRSLGRALFTANGGAEVDRLIAGLSPEAAQQCLQGACERTFRRAPAETVPWLAAHIGTSTTVDETFAHTWMRWTAADATAAEAWRSAAAQSNPRIAPLLESMEGQIVR